MQDLDKDVRGVKVTDELLSAVRDVYLARNEYWGAESTLENLIGFPIEACQTDGLRDHTDITNENLLEILQDMKEKRSVIPQHIKVLRQAKGTLAYALSVFRDTCGCNECGPCEGQQRLKRDIKAIRELLPKRPRKRK